MNPTLQAKLDEVCKKVAAKHSTSEKLINLIIQVQLIVTKLGVVAMFTTSKHINVKESLGTLNTEVTNIASIGASLAGLEDAEKLMAIYSEVDSYVRPLITTYYTEAQGKGGN